MNAIHRVAPIALVMGLASAAGARDIVPFEDLDRDGDGALSIDEASRIENLDFALADRDRNGMISRAEYNRAVGRTLTARCAAPDRVVDSADFVRAMA
jgi:hypothetical protein